MELTKVEQLVSAYFEGNTTLQEEALLRTYFSEDEVAPHLASYKPLFNAMAIAQDETFNKELLFPQPQKTKNRWWIGIAASALVAVGVAGFFMQQPTLTAEEKEAIAAFEKTKEAFQLLSSNFNEGAQELAYIGKFAETKDKILK
ncbi:hypothetical protein G5B37_14805 [Rasiella rasia]|uniref:Uncharacterized protein n=1 Tax=Rasiella rasia TaxID=2744027 RepID=A0A6G6GQE5_9FLAO|nr:hypothetical protein [Rasiella rasia]QIE60778.1 hypothetical protein G5B37_14805 [Rasiella rasia]